MTESRNIYAPRGSLQQYFNEHINDETDDCIEWPHHTGSSGYGIVTINHRQCCVHVASCERAHGPRPLGHEVAHSCDNRRCFNPRHLRWATRRENVQDMIVRGRQNFGGRNKEAKESQ